MDTVKTMAKPENWYYHMFEELNYKPGIVHMVELLKRTS